MQDLDTYFSVNQRPACFTGASWATYAFPDVANPNLMDLVQAQELARGNPLYAHFKITTTFTGAAANYIRFAIVYSNSTLIADVLSNDRLVVARGPDLVLAACVAGVEVDLPLPAPNNLVGGSTRYLALCMQALCPVTDFTGGGVDAWVSPFPRGYGNPAYQSGY